MQKTAQAKESEMFASHLSKLQTRLTTAQQELSKQRKLALQGEKLWKGKRVVQEKKVEMGLLEQEVEKVEILTTPLGDEHPSTEHIKEMDAAVNGVQQKLTEVVKALESAQGSVQGSVKEELSTLFEMAKKSQDRIDEMTETTREQRERVASEAMVQEVRVKMDAVEERLKRIAEAEAPYLRGVEVLPLEESRKAVADSEAVVATVREAVEEGHALITDKTAAMQ